MLEWQQMTFSKQSKTIGKHTRADSANNSQPSANCLLFIPPPPPHEQNKNNQDGGGGGGFHLTAAPGRGNSVWKIYAYLDPN